MNFEIMDVVQLGTLIASIAYLLGQIKSQALDQKEENITIWEQINKQRGGMEQHQKESLEKRLDIERDMSSLKELIIKRDGKLDAIIDKLDYMSKKIDRLEEDNLKKSG